MLDCIQRELGALPHPCCTPWRQPLPRSPIHAFRTISQMHTHTYAKNIQLLLLKEECV